MPDKDNNSKINHPKTNLGTLLIIGDWFIDEYWFISRHHSSVSSHVGPLHFRIVSKAQHAVKDLCGAGLIARVLYELRTYHVKDLHKEIGVMKGIVNDTLTQIKNYLDEHHDNHELTPIYQEYFASKEKLKNLEVFKWHRNSEDDYVSLLDVSLLHNIINTVSKMVSEISTSASHIKFSYKLPKDSNFLESEGSKKRNSTEKRYDIAGIGLWHRQDNKLLPHFIHAHCQKNGVAVRTSFNLTPGSCKQPVDAFIYNLAGNYGDEGQILEHDDDHSDANATIRCVRTYRFEDARFKQVHRLDWEPAPTFPKEFPKAEQWEEALKLALHCSTPPAVPTTLLNPASDKQEIAAVIIDDHLKGTINEIAISILQKKADSNKILWFIRTKGLRIKNSSQLEWPSWLQSINRIHLLAVGPEIATRSYPIKGLLTQDNRLTAHAFDLIDKIIGRQCGGDRKVRNVVLTSDKLEVVALLGDFCFIAAPDKHSVDDDLEKINWTTAFFAGLTYEMVEHDSSSQSWKSDREKCREAVEKAINHGYAHCGVHAPEILKSSTPDSCSDAFAEKAFGIGAPRATVKMVCHWPKMQKDWKSAKSGRGIIEQQGTGGRLEIWRAMTDLPGYINWIDEKRAATQRIWQLVYTFSQRSDNTKSISVLLEADPGVGKTYFAKQIAKQIDCSFISHDVSQMVYREELLDLFDMVAAKQAEENKPVFVFVDEINASLGGSPVYGAFLSPLEGNKYLRRGNMCPLKPCIWMFAGTPEGLHQAEGANAKEKLQDFQSRLTNIERIDYESLKRMAGETPRLRDQAKLEQVYMGAFFINEAFNDVRKIDPDLLEVFYNLEPAMAPFRKMKRLANSLENVQYGRAHKGNCTGEEWRKVIEEIPEHLRAQWTKRCEVAEDEWVAIDFG